MTDEQRIVPYSVIVESLAALLCRSVGFAWPLPREYEPWGGFTAEYEGRQRAFTKAVEKILATGESTNYHETMVLDFARRMGLAIKGE